MDGIWMEGRAIGDLRGLTANGGVFFYLPGETTALAIGEP